MAKRIPVLLVILCLAAFFPVTAFAADAQQVTAMIEKLPEKEDITEENAEEIEKAMEAYLSLTDAEKIRVENYKKLEDVYDAAVRGGYIQKKEQPVDQDKAHAEYDQKNLEESDTVETDAMEFVFTISEYSPDLSIVIHYTTDTNGDGAADIPSRIVLTSPEGGTTPISNSNSALKDETMDIALTWEASFLQLDVAYASEGKWKIVTSDPVTFKAIPYAGVQKKITAKDDKKEEDADAAEPEEEKSGPGAGTIVLIIVMLAALAYLLKTYILKKPGEEPVKKKREVKVEENIPRRMSDEEVKEQMKREFLERKQREEEEFGDDDYDPIGGEDGQDEDYEEIELEEHEEGETGLLRKDDRPMSTGEKDAEEEDDGEVFDDSVDFLDDDAF